jgi:HEXXH motif-containing protein
MRLVREKAQSNLTELIAYSAVLESHLPNQAHSSGFLEYFEHTKHLKAGPVRDVFCTPQGYFWNAITRTLLDVKLHGTTCPPLLNQFLEAFGGDLERAVDAHLHDFGRFALAAAAKAGKPVTFNHPVRLKGPSALPGTGIALMPAIAGTEFEIRELNIDPTRAEESPLNSMQPWPGVTALRMPRWTGPRRDIVVDGWDPMFNLSWVERYPRLHLPEACEKFTATLSTALQCVDRYEPGLLESISLMIDSITPMDTSESGAEMCSGTFSPMFGGCFLSNTPEPMFIAEMLIHEFCHTRLRLAQERISLFESDNPGEAAFYSPWRDDPRPLDAIAHGLFVFAKIARFWLNVHSCGSESPHTRTLALRRLGTLLYQLRYAFDEFTRHARLSAYGAVFAKVIETWIDELESALKPEQCDGLAPFFSGVIRDASLRQKPIREALPQHRANWKSPTGRKRR